MPRFPAQLGRFSMIRAIAAVERLVGDVPVLGHAGLLCRCAGVRLGERNIRFESQTAVSPACLGAVGLTAGMSATGPPATVRMVTLSATYGTGGSASRRGWRSGSGPARPTG